MYGIVLVRLGGVRTAMPLKTIIRRVCHKWGVALLTLLGGKLK